MLTNIHSSMSFSHHDDIQQELGLETAEVELAGYHPEYQRFVTDESRRHHDKNLTISDSSSLSDEGAEEKKVSMPAFCV